MVLPVHGFVLRHARGINQSTFLALPQSEVLLPEVQEILPLLVLRLLLLLWVLLGWLSGPWLG